jgi:uncharacterized protein (DUF1800 family)
VTTRTVVKSGLSGDELLEVTVTPSDRLAVLGRRSVLTGAAGLLAALAGTGVAEAASHPAAKVRKKGTRKPAATKVSTRKIAAKKAAHSPLPMKTPRKPAARQTAAAAGAAVATVSGTTTTVTAAVPPPAPAVVTTATTAPPVVPPVYVAMPAPSAAWPAVFPPAVGPQAAPGGVPLVDDQVQHLLRRAAWGPTPAAVAQVHTLGAAQWLDQQLAPNSIDDSACLAAVSTKFPLLTLSPLHLRKTLVAEGQDYGWAAMQQVQMAALLRQTTSKRQLFEVMVDFWHDHLHVSFMNGNLWTTAHDYDRTVIRPNALGTFQDLLLASAQHPAMMYSLNNNVSTGDNPNENYGRELLELQTVGVGGGYTETDMHQSALALTGFSVLDDGSDEFEYRPGYRYVGPLKVMGWSNPNPQEDGGLAVGQSYLRYLANHPATARHVCTKLAVRFVSDTPSSALIDSLVAAWQANGTAIVPVLRVLFSSNEFWTSPGAKLRRPQEHVVSMLRVLGYAPTADAEYGDWWNINWWLGQAGQFPMCWPEPNGYPDVASAWLSAGSSLAAWNLAVALVDGWWANGSNGVTMTPSSWQGFIGSKQPTTGGELVDRLSLALIGQLLPAASRVAALSVGGMTPSTVLTAANLWLIDPWNLQRVASTVLSSPVWRLR